MGGVKINRNMEVLNKAGKVISGLYATGEVTGGLHGENHIGGNSVAEIIIFGRQARVKFAEFVKAE
ncbi:fumarate reductase flavoprotein subunit [Listeria floridensis FSL S10-1187]|uniref:Fumarate reductase flavoprotein subunit n=1 Tax=Listeria floridensis FSL S10-1187 TaxID=1265817 RepID=A0ABN0RIJ8_9LIST|nr:fumarate reductase flavoprotein subunit [Listeria floridensis FSL S10-1187]